MLDGPDLLSLGNAGMAGTSQASGDTSDPPVSIGVVDSGPGLPMPWFRDRLKVSDFAGNIDPGRPAVHRHGRPSLGSLCRDPASFCQSSEVYRMSRVVH